MSLPTVRANAVFWREKKIAEIFQSELRVLTGSSALFGAEGYYTHSKGAVQCQVELSQIVPVSGTSTTNDLEQYIIAQKDIDIGFIIGEKFVRQTMRVTEVRFSSDTENGRAISSVTLQGGVPKVTG